MRVNGEINCSIQPNLATSYFQTDLNCCQHLNLEKKMILLDDNLINFQIVLACQTLDFKGMLLLDDNLMEKEEKELRKLLPISAILHNCLILAISKESLIT